MSVESHSESLNSSTDSTASSGLEVLSKVCAAMAVEQNSMDTTEPMDTSSSNNSSIRRSPSFKERIHPKFRKNSTPDYLLAADARRSHQMGSVSPPSPVAHQPPMPVVFPPEQQIIHTDEDSNVDVVNESGEEPPSSASQNTSATSATDLPIDLSARKPRFMEEAITPTLPAYKFTPLTLKQPAQAQQQPPPPAYDTRPPPPPYQSPLRPQVVARPTTPPITSTTPPKRVDAQVVSAHAQAHAALAAAQVNFDRVRAQLAVAALVSNANSSAQRAPPPSYMEATSPPTAAPQISSHHHHHHQNVDSNNVSTTTPALLKNRKSAASKKGLSTHPSNDDRPVREITIITDSSADPLLDEHFRRSLGEQKYRSLFNEGKGLGEAGRSPPSPASAPSPTSSTTSSSAKVSPKSAPPPHPHSLPVVQPSAAAAAVDPVKAFHDDMESEGYTVEDHFAKALGDTWVKLQAKAEQEAKAKAETKVTSTTNEARVTVN